MSELKTLVNEVGLALRASDESQRAADEVDKSYNEARNRVLAQFEADHADLVKRKQDADKKADVARESAYQLRKRLEEDTRQWGIDHPNEPKPEIGVELRQFTEADYDNHQVFEACLSHFPYLLQINVKALEQFIAANAEREGSEVDWKNPAITHFLPVTLKIVRRPFLSNDKIKAAAAVSVTEVSSQGENTTIGELPVPDPFIIEGLREAGLELV